MPYRSLIFHCYARILPTDRLRIAASAITRFAHVIFLNWIAVAMTAAGGFLFAWNYARRRSLHVTCIEHSLHSCLTFTARLRRLFSTGGTSKH